MLVLVALGSMGDVFPLIGIGKELQRRGHGVIFLTNPHFERHVRGAGLEFQGIGEESEYLRVISNPDLWHPVKGLKVLAQEGERTLRAVYEAINKLYVPGKTFAVTSALAFGARVAQEKLGIPQVTVHYQPIVLRSVHAPPVLPVRFNLAWLPKWGRAAAYRLADVVIDRVIGRSLNVFRGELGLPPVRRIFDRWAHSPGLTLCMFPEWFAAKQPDWPSQIKQTGFPLYDASDTAGTPPELAEFLSAGPPPVVFTFGSAMHSHGEIFEHSVEACRLGGFRGIVVAQKADLLPRHLPPGVKHFLYVPFGALFPHAAAVVHHGGIGTLSQVLAAGRPQLIVPLAFDQPDNASRLKRLGVAEVIAPSHYRARTVAGALDKLLASSSVRTTCGTLAARMKSEHGVDAACDALSHHFRLPPGET